MKAMHGMKHENVLKFWRKQQKEKGNRWLMTYYQKNYIVVACTVKWMYSLRGS